MWAKTTISFLISIQLVTGLLGTVSCSSTEKKETPITGFSSCIAVDLPPITLTPSRTSAEKQLIGDNIEIEKNGWLIASSRSVHGRDSTITEDGEKDNGEELRQYYREMSVISFYQDIVDRYKSDGLVGETDKGTLEIVPESISPRKGRYRNPDETKNASLILQEVNRSRTGVFNYLKKRGETNDARNAQIRSARKGEWVHDSEKGWSLVK